VRHITVREYVVWDTSPRYLDTAKVAQTCETAKQNCQKKTRPNGEMKPYGRQKATMTTPKSTPKTPEKHKKEPFGQKR